MLSALPKDPSVLKVLYDDSKQNEWIQERKVSPKRKFLGRTSRGHPGVIRADIPAQNFGQGGQNPGKNKHFGADIHDPKARTSTTLRGFQKLRSENLWAEFSPPMDCYAAVFLLCPPYSAVFPAVFRLSYRDPLGTLFGCLSAVFNVGHLAPL